MKRFLRPVLLALALGIPATHAQTTPEFSAGNDRFNLTLQGSVGLVQGESREVVYDVDDYGRRYQLSELIWDIENVAMAGGTLGMEIGGWLRIEGTYMHAITKGSGQMEDYDWMYGPDYPWTHWSLSDVDVKDAFNYDIHAAAAFFRRTSIKVSGLLGYRYQQWGWEDQFRRYIYTDEDFRDSRGRVDGLNAINYEQQFSIPYAGVAVNLKKGKFAGDLTLRFSPFVEAEDKDHHVLRETWFYAEADGGNYVGLELNLGYHLTPSLVVTLGIEGHFIPEMDDADMTISAGGETEKLDDAAGIENNWSMLSLSLGYTF